VNYYKKIKSIHIIIIVFFFINLFLLTNFPFVHSDEAWLSGLSRNMLQKRDLSVTEPFFDLYPRYPHAIKLIFHLIQSFFMKVLGYSIFTFRLISLFAGTVALYLFYKIAKKFTNSIILANMTTIILGLDIQFIYASHFARQEIILVLILLIAFYYFLYKYSYNSSICQDIILGLIIAVSIGIHPNSFVIALPFIFVYTYLLLNKNIKGINYFVFGGTLVLIASFFVILSLKFDPNFIQNYASYGQTLGVFNSISTKIGNLNYFYQKLFFGVSGTYYTPPVKFQLIIFALAFIIVVLQLFFKKERKNILLILMLLGINVGYILIGRYNQTGIIFIFPLCYLLLLNLCSALKRKYGLIITVLIIAVLSFNTISTLLVETHFNYDDYLKEIAKTVGKNDRVLANLNSDYYFNNGKLLDYRNLVYLEDNNTGFSEYIKANHIQYIIYPEEMDFIYNHRPVWNIIYGNIFPYYQDMKEYLNNECKLVHSFKNKTYGMRIVRYIGDREWNIKIYQVIY